jgi:hypothetical protein
VVGGRVGDGRKQGKGEAVSVDGSEWGNRAIRGDVKAGGCVGVVILDDEIAKSG